MAPIISEADDIVNHERKPLQLLDFEQYSLITPGRLFCQAIIFSISQGFGTNDAMFQSMRDLLSSGF